jgi:TRAP-type mannitol/chloroaromatic compound transport system permease small subunit
MVAPLFLPPFSSKERRDMNRVLSAIDSLSVWSGKIFSMISIVVVLATLYEVIMRYFLRLPTIWVTETAIYGCAVMYVMGGAWALYAGQHAKNDLLYGKFTPRGKAMLDVIAYLFFALYMLGLLWASGIYAWESILLGETTGSSWNPPIYPIKVALFVGTFLLFLQGTGEVVRRLYFVISGRKLAGSPGDQGVELPGHTT